MSRAVSRFFHCRILPLFAVLLFSVAWSAAAAAQVSVTATAGTVGPTPYTTVKLAFDAINAGTHQGDITVSIDASTTEGATPATLNSNGAGAALYTSVLVRPSVDGVTISGNPASGFGVIQLNGADNVTIDGDNPNSGGTNRNLTITNTAANTTTYASVVRVALSTLVNSGNSNTVRNCIITGSATGRNISTATSTTGSEHTTYGILVGGGASTVAATTAPSAITSISTTIGTGITATSFTASNNEITACARGIAVQGSAVTVANQLTVTNNVIGSPTPGNTTTVYSRGMTLQGFDNATIASNVIQNMAWFVGTAEMGIGLGEVSASGTNGLIEKNIVNGVNNQATGTFGAYGISVAAGANMTVRNNFVSGVTGDISGGSAFSTTFGIFGIRIAASTGHKIYHNSVNLYGVRTGTVTATTLLSAALAITGTGLTGCDVRNNILSNTQSGGTSSLAYVSLFLPSAGTSAMNLTLNNNAYYSGTTAASQGIAQVGTTSSPATLYLASNFNAALTTPATNLRAYSSVLSAAGTNDNASLASSAAAPFTSSSDLHIPAATSTQLESGGAAGTSVTVDIDNETRPGPPGSVNGGGTANDIGADEFDGAPLDATAPSISYAPLANTTSTSNRAFTNVTVTDASGVNGAPGTRPRVYYKNASDANNTFNDNTNSTVGWKYAEASGATSPFDFTLDYTLLSGAAPTVGDVIQYFVVAQDNAAPANVAINSGTFTVAPASVALTAAAFPIGGTIRSYAIVDAPLNGDYTVGTLLFNQLTGANITFERQVRKVMRDVLEPAAQSPQMTGDKSSTDVNLPDQLEWKTVRREVEEVVWVPMSNGHKYDGDLYMKRVDNPALPQQAAAGIYATITAAVNDLNLRGVSGPVRFLLTDPSYGAETLPITINVSGPAPSAANPVTIKPNTGVTATVSGAGAGSQLFKTINTNYITIDGSNTVGGTTRDLTLENTSITTPQVVLFGSSGTTPITNGTLKNCIVRNGVNTSSAVVISDGATPGNPGYFSTMEVRNNRIEKAFIGVYSNGGTTPANGAGLTYADNQLDTSGADANRLVGLYMQGVNGATVTNNTVANISGVDGENDIGIWLASGTINATVSGNSVSNLGYTGTGAFAPVGINITPGVASANVDVTRNMVASITTSGTTQVRGIASPITTTADVVIQRNNISGITNTNAGTYGAYGIDIASGNNHVVKNNFISDLRFNMTGGAAFSTTFGVFGIRIASGTGHVVAFNSVNMSGSMTGTAASSLLSAALCVVSTTSTGCDIRNNILSNTLTGGTTSIAHVSAYLPSGATSAMNLTWNNNAYYSGGTAASQGIAQAGTTAGTGFYLAGDFAAGATTPANNLRAYTSTLSGAGTNDNASFATTAAAPFLTSTDLHIDPLTPTLLESSGSPVVGITLDYDGDTRNVSTPDIGADEGAFTPLTSTDASAQAFIDPTNGGTKGTGVTFAPQARFANNGTSALTNVPVRFRIVGPAPSLAEIYNDTQIIASLAASGGTAIQSFTSLSIAVTGTYTMYAKAEQPGDTIPANDEITGTFDVFAPLAGTYLVGAAQAAPFNTLTSAIAKLNQVGVSAAVTFSLTDSLYSVGETFPLTINPIQGGSNVNTFQLDVVSGSNAAIRGGSSSAIIILSGADYVTINGNDPAAANYRGLTIQNTTAGSANAVLWGRTTAGSDPATNNSVTYCNIVGGGSGSVLVGIGFGGAAISIASNGTGNNDNSFSYNAISRAAYGIYSAGASAANPNTGTRISFNEMTAAAPANINKAGIFVRFEDDAQILGNRVSLVSQPSGTAAGIAVGLGPVTNVLTATTVDQVSNTRITRNVIVSVSSPSATGFSAVGIIVGGASTGTNTVDHNMISGVTSPATPSDLAAGIYAVAVAGGTTRIYFNSIAMEGARGAGSQPSLALAINGADAAVDIRNNILYNTQTSTGVGGSYAIGLGYATYANLTSDYNLFYTAGPQDRFSVIGGLTNTPAGDRTSLLAWQTETGQDANSLFGDPLFVNTATDLHLSLAGPTVPPGYHAGVTILGFNSDIDFEAHNNPPTIGADEIFDTVAPAVAVTSPNGAESYIDGSVHNITWTATDLFGVTTVDIEYSINSGTSWLPVAAAIANSGTYAWTVPNNPSTNARVRVTARDAASNAGDDMSDADFIIQSQSAVGEQGIPAVTSVGANYPNPFVRTTVIPYGIKENAHVRLDIFDVSGRLVRTLVDEDQAAGYRSLNWDGTDGNGGRVASGVYMVRFIADGHVQTRSLRVVR